MIVDGLKFVFESWVSLRGRDIFTGDELGSIYRAKVATLAYCICNLADGWSLRAYLVSGGL